MPACCLLNPPVPMPIDDVMRRSIDREMMSLALKLSADALGTTWPNPAVGAVIARIRDGEATILGQGVTQRGGRPHGEAMALAEAGGKAAGATLYVALEPCAYSTLRGGVPCVERTLRAGITRVVSALEDPNPRIAGLGHGILQTAGVKVEVGLMANEAARLHKGHIRRVQHGLPTVLLKIARTADGFAGGPGRTRIAISGLLANQWVQVNRSRFDAIMIGIDTALADDPQLTVRMVGLEDRSPVRVVLDSDLRATPALTLVKTATTVPTWIIAADDAPIAPEAPLVAAGAEVMRVERGADGRLDLEAALRLLALRGITRIFSEGGPTVGERLAVLGLADEIVISTSGKTLNAPGIVAVRPALAALLGDDVHFRLSSDVMLDDDRFQTYTRIV